jgi:UMF1 family MFS transporter
MLLLYTGLCVISVALFVTLEPGMILWGFLLAVLANIGFEGALVYYNAYLPDLAPPEKQGFISGLGFGVGYAGSIAGLLIALPLVTRELYDLTWLSVAGFFALFSIPTFLGLPKDRPGERTVLRAALEGIMGFRRILREVLREKNLRRFLLAFFFYIDGVMTVIVTASLFAEKTLLFDQQQLIYLFLVTQVSALAGAMALAKPTDRWGPKRVISLTLLLWTTIVISAYFIETQRTFFVLAVMAGTGLGAVQAASRTMMTALIPKGKAAEMFGFYAFCGKSSSILGPIVFGQVSYMMGGNQRVAVLAIGAFFLLGLLLLQRVRDPRAGN